MIRRILGALLVLLGLVAAALGVASSTIWSPAATATATMPEPESPVVLVEPGVLGLVAETVTVTATAESGDLPVVLAFAPTSDVEAWVEGAAVTRVTGLESWDTLATELEDGDASVPDPATADLWRDELTAEGELVVEITPDPGQVTLLAATDGESPAPRLKLSWPVEVTHSYLVPLLIAGGVLLLAGIAVLAYDAARRRTSVEQVVSREKSERIASANVTDTAAIPVTEDMTEGPLTRRQLRELERRRRARDPRHEADGPIATSGGGVGSSVVPGVPNPERFRALRYVEAVDVPDDARFAPSEEDVRRTAQPLDHEESLAVARGAAGAGIVPDSLGAVEARIADERASAGSSSGAGVVPDSLGAVRARIADERSSAGAASGAGIVPPRTTGASGDPEGAPSDDETPEKVTWRDLWGFRRDSEEQR